MHAPAKYVAKYITANRYDRLEWAGAFGDLGTLLPFVVAYIAVVKMDPLGVLLAMMDGRIRACTHLDVTAAMIEEMVGHVREIVRAV